jgi:hypothetical protein
MTKFLTETLDHQYDALSHHVQTSVVCRARNRVHCAVDVLTDKLLHYLIIQIIELQGGFSD